MKVALQLSGRLKFTENSLNSIRTNIIEKYNPDIYASFWTPETDKDDILREFYSLLGTGWKYLQYIPEGHKNQEFLDELNEFNLYKNLPKMSYQFFQVSQLRLEKSKKTYDCIIQARTDNLILEPLEIPNISLSGIYCSNSLKTSAIDDYISPRMCDNFYLGSQFYMDLASLSFWKLKTQAQENIQNNKLHHNKIPEIIQTQIWQKLNIPIKTLKGNSPVGDFWYDIDRSEDSWK